jgi:hypothetical protein
MTTPSDRRIIFAKRYRELLDGYTSMLGTDLNAVKLATCKTLASLQTQLLAMNDRFANAQTSASDVDQFLKMTATVASLLDSIGLAHVQTSTSYAAEDERRILHDAFKRVIAARQTVDVSDHVEGCRCLPCLAQRESRPSPAAEPKTMPAPAEPGTVKAPNGQGKPPSAPKPPASPNTPNLKLVASSATAGPAPPASTGCLTDQRQALTAKAEALRREIHVLAEPSLTDATVRIRRDQLQSDLNVIEADLQTVNAEIAKQQAASSSTRLYFESIRNAGGPPGLQSFDVDPAWPHLKGM